MLDLNGIRLRNRLVTSASLLGYGASPHRLILYGLSPIAQWVPLERFGAITTRTVSTQPREGHFTLREDWSVREYPELVRRYAGALRRVDAGWINAFGWCNIGIERYFDEYFPRTHHLNRIVSLGGFSAEEFGELVETVNRRAPAGKIAAVEFNVSCHNVNFPFEEILDDVLAQAIPASRHPVIVKLSPDTDYLAAAKVAERNGAAAVTAINAVKALRLDPETGEPLLKNRFGSLSGRAIKPIGLRVVAELRDAGLRLPIIATAGIRDFDDCREFLWAGADAVSLGSEVWLAPLWGYALGPLRGARIRHLIHQIERAEGTPPLVPWAAAPTPVTGQGGSLPPPATPGPHPGHAEGGASRGEQGSPLEQLDPEQRAAAATLDGPLLIVAGPGTGKTRTLTHRIAHLVADRGVAPERCLAITFTRRAAEELEQRLRGLLGERADGVTVATFHRLGLAIVDEQRAALGLGADLRVADEVERLAVLREVSGASETRARRLASELGRRKRERAVASAGSPPGSVAALDDLLDHYDKALRARDLVDFDDLIALPVRLLGADPALAASYRERWPWISVDEYQDVDELQYRLLRLLTTPDGNLCAIGDPDQAIYGFRGADVGYFLRFRQDFPGAATAQLTRNYRSSRAIVDGALQAVAPGTLVRDRVLRAQGQQAAPPRLHLHRAASEAAEAEFVVHTIERLLGGSTFFSFDSGRVEGDGAGNLSFADVAVLYRTDAQALPLVEALTRAGMPFQKRSHDRLADLPAVQQVLRALDAAPEAAGDRSVLARVRRAANQAGVAPADVEALEALATRCGHDLDRFLAELALGAQVDTWDPRADRISLLTLHASKGLEFAVVFLVGCEEGLLPLRFGGAEPAAAELAEERRLLFVGMTRARSHLYLSWAARRARHGVVADSAPSRFLAAVDEALLERLLGAAGRAKRPPDPRGDQLSLLDS
ncbi:MAG TPA: UvrD-helicase domain-containing protein [Actinomycetota bacterium]